MAPSACSLLFLLLVSLLFKKTELLQTFAQHSFVSLLLSSLSVATVLSASSFCPQKLAQKSGASKYFELTTIQKFAKYLYPFEDKCIDQALTADEMLI